jgi:hypothetical protein
MAYHIQMEGDYPVKLCNKMLKDGACKTDTNPNLLFIKWR